MKKLSIIFGFSLFLFSCIFISCKKEDDSTTSQMSHSYGYSDAAGILVATKSFTYDINGGYLNAIEATTATALFPVSGNPSSFNDAGTVSLQDVTLTKAATNMYQYLDVTNHLNIYGNMALQWNVTGNGNISAFSFSANKGIPSFNGLAELPIVVSKGSGAIVDFYGKVAYADSVLVMLSGNNSSVYKVFAAAEPNGQFNPSELKGLNETNAATFTVVPFNVQSSTVNGQRFYFVNETAYYKVNIEIVN